MRRVSTTYSKGIHSVSRRRRGRGMAPKEMARLAAGIALLALVLIPLSAVLGFYTYFQFSQRIVPGVYSGASRLGGMSVTQAAIEIHKTWNLSHQLSVTDGLHTWNIPAGRLGLTVDPLATVQIAYSVGHDQDMFSEADQMIRSLDKGWGIAPVVIYDPQAASAGLEALIPEASLAPVNASLRVQGDQLVEIPGQIGYTINIEDTLAKLAENPRAIMIDGNFRVLLKPVPPAVNDVSAAMAEAETILSTPVQIKAFDPIVDEWREWTPERQAIASWLQIESGPAGPQIRINSQKVSEYVASLSDDLGPERWIDTAQHQGDFSEDVRSGRAITFIVRHKPTTYIVQSGDTLIKIGWKVGMPYWKILEANPTLDEKALYTGQEIVIPSKDELLPLPVVLNKRIVISISEQRLWVYQDGKQISKYVISTGIDRSPTQPGIFQVQTHEINAYASVWDLYMPHFLGVYEAWPGFMNGIHGLPTLSNGQRLWANILGRPASYGCIILDLNAAEKLYKWAENGVIVEIKR